MTFTCENGLNRRFYADIFPLRPPITAKFPKSDHLWKTPSTRIAGRCESAEVAKATTCLYPARFSTPGFTSILCGFQCEPGAVEMLPFRARKSAQKSPAPRFCFALGQGCHPSRSGAHRATLSEQRFYICWKWFCCACCSDRYSSCHSASVISAVCEV